MQELQEFIDFCHLMMLTDNNHVTDVTFNYNSHTNRFTDS